MAVRGFPEFDEITNALKEHFENLTDEQIQHLIDMADKEFMRFEKLNIEISDKLALDTYTLLYENLQEHLKKIDEAIESFKIIDGLTDDEYYEAFDKYMEELGIDNLFFSLYNKAKLEAKITDHKKNAMKNDLKKNEHSLKHTFTWPVPLELGENTAEELMLIKGVAMQEGEMKRGEKMSKENLIFAAGAMSGAAMFGLVQIDIDHFEESLPEKYTEKYGAEINDPYPPALILDASTAENVSGHDGKKYTEVEFIGSCQNALVYQMIKEGKFKGGSVVDYYRKETCDCGHDQAEGDVCTKCEIEGSHFLRHTLILDEVPNSHGTWVDIVSEKDVGTIIAKPTEQRMEEMKKDLKSNAKMLRTVEYLKSLQKKHAVYELDTYMNEDGSWKDGKSSIVAYLQDEKGIADYAAEDMANYLFEHPEALTQYQYENMSGSDLMAWFFHFQHKLMFAKQHQLAKQVAALSLLQHNADGIATLKHLSQLTQEEVNYSAEATDKCNACRWFIPLDETNPEGEGICAIVEGDIIGTGGCDRHEAAEPTDPDPEGDKPEGEGTDPEPEENAEVPINEDGTCPEGYVPNADKTACVIPEKVAPQNKNRNVHIEQKPKGQTKSLNEQLRMEIASDEKKLRSMKVLNTKEHAKYMSLASSIKKKKHTLQYGE